MQKQISNLKNFVTNIRKNIHSNIALIIGSYGLFTLFFLYFFASIFLSFSLDVNFKANLPPAWHSDGDINHILGTNAQGIDLFSYLVVSYKNTMLFVLLATALVIILGAITNFSLFFMPKINWFIFTFFRVIVAVPPILSVIVFALICNNLYLILCVIGISALPRFVYNLHNHIMQEWQKNYIIAYQLDGLLKRKIFLSYILPNVASVYLVELIMVISHLLLLLPVITFLNFGSQSDFIDLGKMMNQTLTLLKMNRWPFISAGLVIMLTIVIINMLNLGIQSFLSKKLGS